MVAPSLCYSAKKMFNLIQRAKDQVEQNLTEASSDDNCGIINQGFSPRENALHLLLNVLHSKCFSFFNLVRAMFFFSFIKCIQPNHNFLTLYICKYRPF